MKRHLFYLIFFITSLVIFSACDKNHVFEKNLSVTEKGWNKDSLFMFNVQVDNTLQNNNFYINIRNDIKYKYSNLWLFVEITNPEYISVTDTFEVTLADPSGEWLGEGFGGVKNRQVLFKRNVYFPVTGDYKIKIRQGMRDDVLYGITDIGIRIEKKD